MYINYKKYYTNMRFIDNTNIDEPKSIYNNPDIQKQVDLFVNLINTCFLNIQDKTSSLCNHKFRKSHLSYNDALLYRFLYSFDNKSQNNICSRINNTLNYHNIDKNNYVDKEKPISIDVYKYIRNDLRSIHINNFAVKSAENVLAIDAVTNNTNIDCPKNTCQTSLNMGYFDVTNGVPVDFTIHISKKNNEVNYFKEHIQTLLNKSIFGKKINTNAIIIVADRAYFCYDLFDYLDNLGVKFVIRIRGNAKIISDNNTKYRIIKTTKNTTKNVKYKKKKNKEVTVNITDTSYLITNLTDIKKYSNKKIKNLYKSRWSIETYFGYMRNNYKFSNLVEQNTDSYEKLLLCIQSITYIAKIIELIFLSTKKIAKKMVKNDGENVKCTEKINKTLLTQKINEDLLIDIIQGTLTSEQIMKFIKLNCKTVKHEKGRFYERKSKTPFTKWYVKDYHGEYEIKKIIEYIIDNKIKINKNLKMKANNVKIIDIQ